MSPANVGDITVLKGSGPPLRCRESSNKKGADRPLLCGQRAALLRSAVESRVQLTARKSAATAQEIHELCAHLSASSLRAHRRPWR